MKEEDMKVLNKIVRDIMNPSIRDIAETWIRVQGYNKLLNKENQKERIKKEKTRQGKIRIKEIFDMVKRLKQEGFKGD